MSSRAAARVRLDEPGPTRILYECGESCWCEVPRILGWRLYSRKVRLGLDEQMSCSGKKRRV